jgi:uncharacterized protein YbaP (TraB family)
VSVNAQLFWKVTGNELTKPSYIFGTHHLIEKEKIAGFDKVLAIIPQTDVVVGEMDLSNILSMQLKMMKEVIMKDTTISDLLSKENYMLVDSQFKNVLGKGLDKFAKMKPIFLSTLFEIKLYMNQNNLKKEPEAVDIVFQKEGKKQKKEIIGLETVDQQINILFNSLSLKKQAEILVLAVKDKDNSALKIKQLNEAYLKGDLKMLSHFFNSDVEMTSEYKKIMIEYRNNNWISQLKLLMPKQSCFVAIGCMHLVDERGLIHQLKNAGYTVEAVEGY